MEASFERALTMADDEKVPTGTRYDALRMIPLLGWERSGPRLKHYLKEGQHAELQMGAVSGLSDVDSPEVAPLLGNALGAAPGLGQCLAPLKLPKSILMGLGHNPGINPISEGFSTHESPRGRENCG